MRKLFMTFAVVALGCAAGPASAAQERVWDDWTASPAQYTVVTEKNAKITMSDGIVLAADVLRPGKADGTPVAGRFPVILTQTPYNKNVGKPQAPELVEHGYVQVIADVRGTGSSEGAWDGLGAREQRDGYELIEWANHQPWANGSVGLRGNSYLAVNQFFTAAQHPPGLKAIFPIVPMGDAYRDLFLQGGQVNTEFLSLWFGLVTGTSLAPATYAPSDPGMAARVLANHAGGAVSYQGGQVIDAMTGGDVAYDGPLYRSRSPLEVIDRVDVPVFITGGWFDLFQRGEPMLFNALQRRGVPVRLLMGPWYHNTPAETLPAPAAGIPSLADIELRWMDHYVKGLPDPGLDNKQGVPPVTAFENGSDRWLARRDWQGKDVQFRALHLGGSATPAQPGTLGFAAPAPSAADTLLSPPNAAVCSRSTVQWTTGVVAGSPCDEDNRVGDAGGLAYDLPISSELRLAGTINAHLVMSSTQGRNALISARLEDVTPGGAVRQISAGWQLLSHRALDPDRTLVRDGILAQPYHPFTRAAEQPMPADGSPTAVDVEIFPTSWALEPGHTLRLTLQTSDAPHLSPTAPQAAGSAGAVLSILHDAAHDSYVAVPVVSG